MIWYWIQRPAPAGIALPASLVKAAEILTVHQDKAHGLSVLMRHLTGRQVDFTPEQTAAVCECRVAADTVTAKRRG